MTKRQVNIITMLSIAAIALGLLVSRRLWFRLDLTKNHTYTISEVSKNLYKEIPDQVRITYFLSEKLSATYPMPAEIESLLREYAAYSHGKIRVSVKDPAKANMVEAVQQLGIQPQQIQTVDKDQASVATVFTGIAIEYLDKAEALPTVFSVDTLEYDLTSRIRSMIRGTEQELGVIVGDSRRQWAQDYQYLDQSLRQAGFRVREIRPGDEIPDALNALFVFGGVEDLDEWALYRIDRFVQNGGHALFATEAVAVDTQGSLEARNMEDKGLLSMLSVYGATIKPALVLDKSALTIQYQTATRSGARQIRLSRYPLWIGILNGNGNPKQPITSNFSGVDVFWASPIDLNPQGAVKADTLFTTTKDAWLETKNFSASPEDAYLLEAEQADTTGQQIMGAVLSGAFRSYFTGIPKPVREGSEEQLPDMPSVPKEARVIVIGDSDIASAFIQRRENLDFMVQAALFLSNDDDIIGIRSRQAQAGRLDKILDPMRRSSAMSAARMTNVVLVPLAVIAAGLFLGWRRKQRGN
jgi:gliding-associated putative ABC transporter substrate-binding component GldG